MTSITLKEGREESLLRRHPWIFSGAISRVDGVLRTGETVAILTSDGRLCGRGAFSPYSQIAVRVWTFNPEEEVSEAFLRNRLARAISSRHPQQEKHNEDCGRLVYAESDGFPGLIVDRYADFLVCQFLAAGAEFWKDTIVALLEELSPCRGIYERSDTNTRDKEGLPRCTGILRGQTPPDLVEIREGRRCFLVDIKRGHKTGFYLDQRDNRLRAAEYMRDAEVLDCFAYTGGFSVVALKAGAAQVISVDSSSGALDLAQRNISLNRIDASQVELKEDDVFTLLRRYRDSRRQFDVIILDPPKFAASRLSVERACRGYKDINMLACKLLRPGGVLITFSCSQHVSLDLFQKTVAYAAIDAKRDVQTLEWLHQASDHATALNFPEGNYLKGMICRVW
ncbi:MAG: class I SAM-dependent methyltransferase [Pseudomonadota bacterium]